MTGPVLVGELRQVFDMPVLADGPAGRRNVNAALLAEIVANSHAAKAFVQHVGARPGEDAVAGFAFDRCYPVVEAVLAALGLPIAFLTTPSWKRAGGIPPGRVGADDAARSKATRRRPDSASSFARAKDRWRVAACLIVIAGLMRTGGCK